MARRRSRAGAWAVVVGRAINDAGGLTEAFVKPMACRRRARQPSGTYRATRDYRDQARGPISSSK
jgi:hypothetical protein